jgi:hypothetical protein
MAPRYRTGMPAIVAATAVALLVAGCGGAGSPTPGPTAAPKASAPTSKPTATAVPWSDPDSDLVGETVLARTGRRTGGEQLPLRARRSGGVVSVGYECQGAGKLTVTVGAVSYPGVCTGTPGGSYNEQSLAGSAGNTLRVTADPGVTWAVAVGWRPSAKK